VRGLFGIGLGRLAIGLVRAVVLLGFLFRDEELAEIEDRLGLAGEIHEERVFGDLDDLAEDDVADVERGALALRTLLLRVLLLRGTRRTRRTHRMEIAFDPTLGMRVLTACVCSGFAAGCSSRLAGLLLATTTALPLGGGAFGASRALGAGRAAFGRLARGLVTLLTVVAFVGGGRGCARARVGRSGRSGCCSAALRARVRGLVVGGSG